MGQRIAKRKATIAGFSTEQQSCIPDNALLRCPRLRGAMPILRSNVDTSSEEFHANAAAMRVLTDDLSAGVWYVLVNGAEIFPAPYLIELRLPDR